MTPKVTNRATPHVTCFMKTMETASGRQTLPDDPLCDAARRHAAAWAEVTVSGTGRLSGDENFVGSAVLGCIWLSSGSGKRKFHGYYPFDQAALNAETNCEFKFRQRLRSVPEGAIVALERGGPCWCDRSEGPMTGASTSANHVTATSNGSGPRATSHISGRAGWWKSPSPAFVYESGLARNDPIRPAFQRPMLYDAGLLEISSRVVDRLIAPNRPRRLVVPAG